MSQLEKWSTNWNTNEIIDVFLSGVFIVNI